MPNYKVLINDNAYYMDESERSDYGVFGDADGAIAACKEIVDEAASQAAMNDLGLKSV